MNPYLFLDFDGVLHPQYEGQAAPADVAFCHLPRFEAVMRDFPSVEIVISSTWRLQFSLDNLRARFSVDIGGRVVGATPVPDPFAPPLPEQRETEILAWLSANDRQHVPWIALDDAFWEFKRHRDRVVVCKSYVGLDDVVAGKLRAALMMCSVAS